MKQLFWESKTWQELNKEEVHEILRIRSKVFVVEQNCVYQDIDKKDLKAIHLLGKKNKKIIAYSRLFKSGDYFFNEASFGRALVKKGFRKKGIGSMLVCESVKAIKRKEPNAKIKISAQAHLKKFYKTRGFKEKGEEYLEDGIPHISMEHLS
ncbi:MAG: GNAT family N-acetyltransferase [Flavobacteriaceae bacterium]|nr:GNAT family N-acetyltransferase [Flavobacteriaceae bacterium]